jgi:putative transcriptional regulator
MADNYHGFFLFNRCGARSITLSMNNQLKVLRGSHQWTQEDVANRLGGARQTIITKGKGKYDPSLPLGFRAARLFELPIEEVFQIRINFSYASFDEEDQKPI